MLLMESEKKVLFLTLQVILANQKTIAHSLHPMAVEMGQTTVVKLLGNMQTTTEQAMAMVETVVKSLR